MMTNHRYSQDEPDPKNGVSHGDKPKISRAQQRHNERVAEEAKTMLETLANKYLDAFTIADDPGNMTDFAQQVSKQWRTYCKRKGLVPQVYPAIDDYIKSVHADYAKIDEPEITATDQGDMPPEESISGE